MNILKSNKGFSLIELMIAVVIIGVLAAIAIPNYQKYQRKSRQAEAKSTLAAMYTSQKSFIAEYGGATDAINAIGYAPEGRIIYDCGLAAAGAAGTFPARYPAASQAAAGVAATTVEVCGGAGAVDCVNGTADLGAAGAPVGANAAIAGATFTHECLGNLGVAGVDDIWTIDNQKTLATVSDGT